MMIGRFDVVVLAAALSLPFSPAHAQSARQQTSGAPAATARACIDADGHSARCGPNPEVWHECRAALEPFGRCRDDPACFDSDREVKCVIPVRYREFLIPAVPTTSLEPGDFYPALAMRQNEQGVSGLRLVVAADGRVSQCTVTQPSDATTLDAASCQLATRRWRFTPATYRGQAVESVYLRNVTWRIRSIN